MTKIAQCNNFVNTNAVNPSASPCLSVTGQLLDTGQ